MNQLPIRLAVAADLPAMVAIYNSTVAGRQSTADLHPVSVASRQAWFDAHGGRRPLWVWEEDGQIAAWGGFSDYYPRAAYQISAEISIYVHADYRGRGLASRLLSYMLAAAPALGIRNAVAVVFGHNTPSLRLFARHGFAEWGRLPQVCDLDGELADVLLLGKCLAAEEMAPT